MQDGRSKSLRRPALGLYLLSACLLWHLPAGAAEASFARVLASSGKRHRLPLAILFLRFEKVGDEPDLEVGPIETDIPEPKP